MCIEQGIVDGAAAGEGWVPRPEALAAASGCT
jgi:hypothetical protein